MNLPVGDFPILTAFYGYSVLPDGAKPKQMLAKPVGSGPWKYESFKPGARSVFTANKDYWVHDGPYIDELTIDSSFTEESARLNSLLSGQSKVMQAIPFALARRQKDAGQIKLLEATGTSFQCFAMRVGRGSADRRPRAAGAAAARGPAGSSSTRSSTATARPRTTCRAAARSTTPRSSSASRTSSRPSRC